MAKRITTCQFSKRFKKEYNKLPKEIQKTFDQKLQLFLQDMFHPSLRVKHVQRTKTRWEGSVTMKYWFTFEFLKNGLIFRAIGTHDILNRESQ